MTALTFSEVSGVCLFISITWTLIRVHLTMDRVKECRDLLTEIRDQEYEDYPDD